MFIAKKTRQKLLSKHLYRYLLVSFFLFLRFNRLKLYGLCVLKFIAIVYATLLHSSTEISHLNLLIVGLLSINTVPASYMICCKMSSGMLLLPCFDNFVTKVIDFVNGNNKNHTRRKQKLTTQKFITIDHVEHFILMVLLIYSFITYLFTFLLFERMFFYA